MIPGAMRDNGQGAVRVAPGTRPERPAGVEPTTFGFEVVNPFVGRNAIYVGRDLPQTVKGAFQEVQPLRKILPAGGQELTVYLCLGYQTLPL